MYILLCIWNVNNCVFLLSQLCVHVGGSGEGG